MSLANTGSQDPNVAWKATNLPPGLSIGSLGLISGTISDTSTAAGIHPVVVTATDDGVSSTFGLTWTVGPFISSASPSTVTEGSGSFLLSLIGIDFQSASTVTVAGPLGSRTLAPNVFSSTSVTVTVPSILLDQDSVSVTITTPDGSGVTGKTAISNSFSLTVTPPPSLVFTYPSQVSLPASRVTGVFPTIVTPVGDPNVTSWNITGLPPGLTYNTGTGIISGTISATGSVGIDTQWSPPPIIDGQRRGQRHLHLDGGPSHLQFEP